MVTYHSKIWAWISALLEIQTADTGTISQLCRVQLDLDKEVHTTLIYAGDSHIFVMYLIEIVSKIYQNNKFLIQQSTIYFQITWSTMTFCHYKSPQWPKKGNSRPDAWR